MYAVTGGGVKKYNFFGIPYMCMGPYQTCHLMCKWIMYNSMLVI